MAHLICLENPPFVSDYLEQSRDTVYLVNYGRLSYHYFDSNYQESIV